jgi:outer membrane protein TolC
VGGDQLERESDAGSTSRRSTLRVSLEQPLFRDFGALVNREPITRAEQQLLNARRDWESQRSELVVDVVRGFESLIQLRQQQESDEASFRRMDKLYRLTVARERQGRASRVDTLRVELQRGQAQSRWDSTRDRLGVAERDFAELLGAPSDTRYELTHRPCSTWNCPTRPWPSPPP